MTTEANQVITKIIGEDSFKTFLLGHNISVGTIFSFAYTSKLSGLINIVVFDKILSIRANDFENIEYKTA